eukprot:scaffold99449_cov18-Tisochrysis_lutea.AAC.2
MGVREYEGERWRRALPSPAAGDLWRGEGERESDRDARGNLCRRAGGERDRRELDRCKVELMAAGDGDLGDLERDADLALWRLRLLAGVAAGRVVWVGDLEHDRERQGPAAGERVGERPRFGGLSASRCGADL